MVYGVLFFMKSKFPAQIPFLSNKIERKGDEFMRFKNRAPRTRRRPGRHRGIVVLLVVCAVLSLGFSVLQSRMRPVVEQYAVSRVTYLATRIINNVIDEELSQAGGVYDNLVSFEKNQNGDIAALKTDIVRINQLKAAITSRVAEELAQLDTSQIAIPLGNLLGGDLLSGRGPKIPVQLVPVGSVTANFISAFTNAGINQTRHQIVIDATVSMSVIAPGTRAGCQVNTKVNIAETILIGNVPEGYTYIDDTSGGGILQKYNDYAEES